MICVGHDTHDHIIDNHASLKENLFYILISMHVLSFTLSCLFIKFILYFVLELPRKFSLLIQSQRQEKHLSENDSKKNNKVNPVLCSLCLCYDLA